MPACINRWLVPGMVERLKTSDTPYQTDLDYKQAPNEQLPETRDKLAALGNKYDGSYLYHIGKILHIQQVTQFTSGFPVIHLAQFNVAPNKVSFEGLKQEARFLANHLHNPIIYAKRKFKGYQTMRFEYKPCTILEHLITNIAHICVNADHSRNKKNSRYWNKKPFSIKSTQITTPAAHTQILSSP